MKNSAKLVWMIIIAICMIFFVVSATAEAAECEHEWVQTETLREATCEVKGMYKEVCNLCGATQYVSRYGHETFIIEAVAPTCVSAGNTGGEQCSLCSAWIVEAVELPIDPEAHVFQDGVCELCGYAENSGEDCTHENYSTGGYWFTDVQVVEGSVTDTTCSYTRDIYEERVCLDCGAKFDILYEEDYLAENRPHNWGYKTNDGEVIIFCTICDTVNPCEHEWSFVGEDRYNCDNVVDNGDGTHSMSFQVDLGYRCTLCNVYYWVDGGEGSVENEPHEYWDLECRWCGAENPCEHENSVENGYNEYGNVTVHSYDATTHTITSYRQTWYICQDCGIEYVIISEEPEYVEATLPHLYDNGVCWVCDYVNTCAHPDFEYTYEGYEVNWDMENFLISVTADTHTYWAREYREGQCPDCGEWFWETGDESFEQTDGHSYDGGVCWLCGYENTCTHPNFEFTYEGYEVAWDREDYVIEITADAHTFWAVDFRSGNCPDCGEWICEYGDEIFEVTEVHGYDNNGICWLCGYEENADACEHSWIVAIEPSCTEEGLYLCAVCGVEQIVSVNGHVIDEYYVEPGCTVASGVERVCQNCGYMEREEFDESHALYEPALGHEWVEAGDFEAGCDYPGGIVYICARCGEERREVLYDEDGNELKPALGHEFVTEDRDAGCEEDGYIGRVLCSVCGLVFEEGEVIPSKGGHVVVITEIVREPSCTVNGIGKAVCEVCEESLGYVVIQASHVWEIISESEPTCEDNGWVERTCEACGETQTLEIAALGHIAIVLEGVEATCTESGISEGAFCEECGLMLIEQEEIPAYGHKWTEIAPTCSADGGRLCVICGLSESIPATGEHADELVSVLKAPSCTTDGIGRYVCSVCGVDQGYKTIPASHSWMIIKETPATCVSDGIREQLCTVCGESETVLVASNGDEHAFTEETWFSTEEGELTRNDAGFHTFTGLVHVELTCELCGATESYAEEGTVIESHSFETRYGNEDEDPYCICACGEMGHDPANLERTFITGDDESYKQKSNSRHSVYKQLGYTYQCMACGQLAGEVEWLDAEAYSGQVAHTFVDGICKQCGWEEVVTECDHSDYYIDYHEDAGQLSYQFTDITNSEYHVNAYMATEHRYCRFCNEYLGEGDTVLLRSTSPHVQYAGAPNCEYCGYEFACQHENRIQKLGADAGVMEWVPKNERYHTFYGYVFYYDECIDCGTEIYSEYYPPSFMSDTNGLEQEHNLMMNGHCVWCGYVPEGIVLCDSEHTYAVPGMEFDLTARLLGTNPTAEGISYSTSDDSIVTVTADGRLLATGRGVAEITVSADGFAPDTCKVFVLPAMVPPAAANEIRAEAFAGSAVRALDLSALNGVVIGENAFANCGKLVCVLLPEEAEIAENAFDADNMITFYCPNQAMADTITQMGHTAVLIG